jgi:hypothetical protein
MGGFESRWEEAPMREPPVSREDGIDPKRRRAAPPRGTLRGIRRATEYDSPRREIDPILWCSHARLPRRDLPVAGRPHPTNEREGAKEPESRPAVQWRGVDPDGASRPAGSRR